MRRHLFNSKTFFSDLSAGITLGIESIPDAMASALLAGVNPIQGVYAVLLSTPVGALFTSSVFMSIQTTSAMSLIVFSVPQIRQSENGLGYLMALALLTGLFMILLGMLKMGTMLRFVPKSVMTGFINGVAVLIILGQLSDLTGYNAQGANKVFKTIDLLLHFRQIHLPAFFIGLFTIVMIVMLTETRLKSFGLVAALILASLLVPVLKLEQVVLVSDIAEIPKSLPLPAFPPLSAFPAMIIPAIALALVGLVQGAGVSQTYANPDGKYPDFSGDFIGQGVANLAAGLFRGMPVGGSLSATALVVNSGARTRFANISAGLTMLVALLIFTQVIGALAMPALAGLLIVIGYQTLKIDDLIMVWKVGLIQATIMVVTFVSTLFIPLQYAVLMGVGVSVIMYVFRQSNKITIKEWIYKPGGLFDEQDVPADLPSNQVLILNPYGSLFFAAAPAFENYLPAITPTTQHTAVILNLRGRDDLGYTFLEVLQRYASDLQQHDCRLLLAEVSEQTRTQLEYTGYILIFGRDNIFDAGGRLHASLLDAYDRAQKWVRD